MKRVTQMGLWLFACCTLAACAPGREFMRDGQQMIDQGRVEDGLAKMEKGAQLEPENREYRMRLIRERDLQVAHLLIAADTKLAAGQLDAAADLYRRADTLAPNQPRARSGLEAVEAARLRRRRTDQAESLLAAGKSAEALQVAQAVLRQDPTDLRAKAVVQRAEPTSEGLGDELPPVMRAALRKPVTLDFHDANIKSVFEALARSTGLNFVFDREVRPDIKVTLSVANLSIDDVVGVLTITNQLERKRLNDNTFLIYPNTLAKQKDYLDLNVRTFYLANAEAKAILTMLKTVLKSRDIYADEKLNSITLRDTPDAIQLAGKLIAAQDFPEPEVMLDVEVLEVKRSRMVDIGIDPPSKLTVMNLVQNPATVIANATGATTVQDNTLTSTQLTLDRLRGVRGSSVGIDNPSLNLRSENGDTNILANPRIRVKNHDKARVMIGDRVPVITTTSTPNTGVSESVSYLDVGLKLDVEPNVFLDNEVGVKLTLEVSNIVNTVKGRSGSLTYQIGTRLASTNLRLKDGETQALAGLISDEDRRSTAGIPGMTDLPVLGRLMSTENGDHSKTEIVLLITPRVVRNIGGGSPKVYEYASGTESTTGSAQLRLHGVGRVGLASSGGAPSPASGPTPEREEEPATTPPPAPVAPPASAPPPVPPPAAASAPGR